MRWAAAVGAAEGGAAWFLTARAMRDHDALLLATMLPAGALTGFLVWAIAYAGTVAETPLQRGW